MRCRAEQYRRYAGQHPFHEMLNPKLYRNTGNNSRTRDLAGHRRKADIIIAALGKPRFIKADMVKDGAIVVDVGITEYQRRKRKADSASWRCRL